MSFRNATMFIGLAWLGLAWLGLGIVSFFQRVKSYFINIV